MLYFRGVDSIYRLIKMWPFPIDRNLHCCVLYQTCRTRPPDSDARTRSVGDIVKKPSSQVKCKTYIEFLSSTHLSYFRSYNFPVHEIKILYMHGSMFWTVVSKPYSTPSERRWVISSSQEPTEVQISNLKFKLHRKNQRCILVIALNPKIL